MDTQFTAGVIFQLGEDGVEYLVQEYDSGQGIQVKFPGGVSDDHPGETPIETLHREIRTETGFVLPFTPKEIWRKEIRGRGGVHTKYAYAIPRGMCAGEMRTESMVDQGGDKLSPLFWRTGRELESTIYHTHQPILEAARKHCESF